MSNFGAKLAELLERHKWSQAEFSRLTGLTEGMISKWINGQQTFVSESDLRNLCSHISSQPKEQAELLRAHLQDELGAPGTELITISIKGQISYLKESGSAYRAALPPKLQRAFDILEREAASDPDLRAVIFGLTNLVAPETREE